MVLAFVQIVEDAAYGASFTRLCVVAAEALPVYLVVLRKSDGKLAMQYSSPAFDNLKDLFVDESKKVMYVMSGTTVYKIPLQHL